MSFAGRYSFDDPTTLNPAELALALLPRAAIKSASHGHPETRSLQVHPFRSAGERVLSRGVEDGWMPGGAMLPPIFCVTDEPPRHRSTLIPSHHGGFPVTPALAMDQNIVPPWTRKVEGKVPGRGMERYKAYRSGAPGAHHALRLSSAVASAESGDATLAWLVIDNHERKRCARGEDGEGAETSWVGDPIPCPLTPLASVYGGSTTFVRGVGCDSARRGTAGVVRLGVAFCRESAHCGPASHSEAWERTVRVACFREDDRAAALILTRWHQAHSAVSRADPSGCFIAARAAPERMRSVLGCGASAAAIRAEHSLQTIMFRVVILINLYFVPASLLCFTIDLKSMYTSSVLLRWLERLLTLAIHDSVPQLHLGVSAALHWSVPYGQDDRS
ncbi:hypothetical protein B0H19DRAFT_1254181 [Mycena capillaripes]|nr:hypothetical protein B0H19DRAFT_1254181 [Mycena capillaripes]